MTARPLQVASTIRTALEEVLARGLSDPRIRGLLTITEVRVTDDLRTAIVRVSVLPEQFENRSLAGLRSASRHIRRKAGDLVALKQMPDLVFELDRAPKRQAGVLEALSRASAEHESPRPTGAFAPSPEPEGSRGAGRGPGEPGDGSGAEDDVPRTGGACREEGRESPGRGAASGDEP